MDDNKGLKIVLIVLIVLTIIVFAAITYLYVFDDKDNSSKSNYSKKAQEVMKEYNIYNTINDKEYSKTLEAILEEDLYNNEIFIEQENYDKEHSLIAFMNEDIRKIIENKVGEITLKSLDSIEELIIEGPLSNNYLEDLRQLKNLKTLVINNMEINAMQLEHNQNLTDITFNNCTINNFDKLPNTIKKLQTYGTTVNGNYMAIPYEAEEVSIWASNTRNIIFKNIYVEKSL